MGKYQGNQVALGIFPNPQVYAFRKDKFTEAGLDPQNPPATWEELKNAAEVLNERDGDKVVLPVWIFPQLTARLFLQNLICEVQVHR